MRFSIITITYNAEKYLAQTLTSVAAQTFLDKEHILWDGGSKDQTLHIAKQFPQINLIQGKDHGIADAMNRAAAHAQGDFLLFLHADDLFPHEKVLAMYDHALKLHPHYEWMYGRSLIINEHGDVQRITPYEPYSSKRLRKYNFITHPATLVSRKLFNHVGGFQTHLKYCMDYDLWLRLSQISTPLALPTVLASFREHTQSLSTSEPLNVSDEAYQVRNLFAKSPYERLRSYLTWKKRRKRLLRTE